MKYICLVIGIDDLVPHIHISYDSFKEEFWEVHLNWNGFHHLEIHNRDDKPTKEQVALRILKKYAKRFNLEIKDSSAEKILKDMRKLDDSIT